jgi:hypothetical protein
VLTERKRGRESLYGLAAFFMDSIKLIFDSWPAHLKTGPNDINWLAEFYLAFVKSVVPTKCITPIDMVDIFCL